MVPWADHIRPAGAPGVQGVGRHQAVVGEDGIQPARERVNLMVCVLYGPMS